jgi:hypothetical protein
MQNPPTGSSQFGGNTEGLTPPVRMSGEVDTAPFALTSSVLTNKNLKGGINTAKACVVGYSCTHEVTYG